MTHAGIAATIAYSMDDFTYAERMRIAARFADELRLKGARRDNFILACRKVSEHGRPIA